MYAVVLSYDRAADLRMIDRAHRYVLDRMADGLRGLLPDVARQGTSDLTTGGRKFSGNSLRCKRRYFLYHGSLLYGLDAELIARCLKMPPRQPDYRQGRGHRAFLTNVALDARALRAAVIDAWSITGSVIGWPVERVAQLVRERYSCSDWTFRFG
jgi:lipoate-protein ligase A